MAWTRERALAYSREYRKTHKAERSAYAKQYRLKNKDHYDRWRNIYRQNNKSKIQNESAERNMAYKKEAFAAYSDGKICCARCSVSDIDVLTLDHIDGGGRKHRAAIKLNRIYLWVKREKYPPGFQVLCMNCNWKKHIESMRAKRCSA